MTTITTSAALRALLGPDGRVTTPVTLAPGCWLYGLSRVTSLAGVTLAEGCTIYDLTSLTSLAGVTLAPGCELHGLSRVTSLAGVTLAPGCRLHDLSALTSLRDVTVPPEEADLLDLIPPDRVEMDAWHCGTSHCLAGWAETLRGREYDEDTGTCGRRHLPLTSALFYAPTEPIRAWLQARQYRQTRGRSETLE